jgi:hypothetical protein
MVSFELKQTAAGARATAAALDAESEARMVRCALRDQPDRGGAARHGLGRGSAIAKHMTARTAVIHDLRRDWRRWTTAERVLASVIMAVFLIGTTATILMTA